ncbi:hypothetical protein C8F01DRAFT_1261495 [Mycena amicta]|nr:hypothetical protein C8F01DRAFT_1261495 [Mycena amicta]
MVLLSPVDVQGGGYASDFLTTKRPRRIAPDSDVWQVSFPMAPSLEVPILDAERDYGLFVRKVIEAEVFPDKEEYITMEEQMKQLSEVSDRDGVKTLHIHRRVWMYASNPQPLLFAMDGLARKPRTWRDFVEATDWSGVFV